VTRGIALLAALVAAAGCVITFGDDGDIVCPPAQEGPPLELRDPYTGTCQLVGGGGGDGDGNGDGRCDPPLPDWAWCYRYGCEALDEGTCLATRHCRGAYVLPDESPPPPCVPGADCWPVGPAFLECWGVPPLGTRHESCDGLDAYACSRDDECIAVYRKLDRSRPPLSFAYCASEGPKVCYQDSECGDGHQCYRTPDECWPPPDCAGSGEPACPPVCYGRCVPKQSCDTIRCVVGSHCEEQCYPCDSIPGQPDDCLDSCRPICVADTSDA